MSVLREGIEILYAFLFRMRDLSDFVKGGVFENIGKLCRIPELKSLLIVFFYKCTLVEGVGAFYRNEEILTLLVSVLGEATEDRLYGIQALAQLSLDRECASLIAKCGGFAAEIAKKMFMEACENPGQESKQMLKLLRNIAEDRADLVTGYDVEIVAAVVNNATKMDALADVLAVANRGKMTTDRAKWFVAHEPFMKVVTTILNQSKVWGQAQLECVMFVGTVVLYSKPAQDMAKMGVVDTVVNLFLLRQDELDYVVQILFVFYRFICHSDTRQALLAHQDIVDRMVKLSASRNPVVNAMANTVLDTLITFDPSYREKLKLPRFDAFNQEWLQAIDFKLVAPKGVAKSVSAK
jgi:hypothetical protein